jgi:hypothetical protein
MIKKARTRLNFFLQVNERLPDKDFRIWNKEKHRRVELKTKNNKTSSMNTKATVSLLVQGPSTVLCMIVTYLSELSH